jgi:hypothetical protein
MYKKSKYINQIKEIELTVSDDYLSHIDWKEETKKLIDNDLDLRELFDKKIHNFHLVNWYQREFNFKVKDVIFETMVDFFTNEKSVCTIITMTKAWADESLEKLIK